MLSVHKTTVFFFKSTSKHEKQWRGTGTGRQFVLTARTKTIERTGTGRQFPPSLASLSATKFSLQIYMELTGWYPHTRSFFATLRINLASQGLYGGIKTLAYLAADFMKIINVKSLSTLCRNPNYNIRDAVTPYHQRTRN